MIGAHWEVCLTFDPNGSYEDADPREVVIVAVETNHVLVELVGVENRWGGPERRWLPRVLFENGNVSFAYPVRP